MPIYLFVIEEEQRFTIKQIHQFASDYLRSWFANLGSYSEFSNKLIQLSEAFRNLASSLPGNFIPPRLLCKSKFA